MDSEYWRRVERVLDVALESDPSSWKSVLDDACGGDVALRAEAENLLSRFTSARSYLASPPIASAAALVAEAYETAKTEGAEGRRIGAYRIVRQIGRGGMSRVYLAERADGVFEQQVALKVLRPGLDAEIDHDRFRAERQILATLDHPHIARLLDGGITDDGAPYLVLEYVDGQPIDTYCNEQSLDVATRLRLFLDVADATQHAHRRLVVHRDLKPSNIFVARDGVVKLLDFGLAKLLEADSRGDTPAATHTANRWMTPEYAAPEQVRGESVTTLTDVYQLGAVLYQLLAGVPPFGHRLASVHELEERVLRHEPAAPSSVAGEERRRALRGDLDAIVLKALSKKPDERYVSAAAMADDVRRHMSGHPVTARHQTAGYRARLFVRRHRAGLAAAAAIVVLLGVYVGTVLVDRSRVERALAEATTGTKKAEQVTDFMLGLFEASESGRGFGDTITARALLDRGIERAHADTAQPAVRAQMLDVVGRLEEGLGDIDRSIPLLEEALAIRRKLYGSDHPEIATSVEALAQANYHKGDYKAAVTEWLEAFEIRQRLFGEADPSTTRALFGVAAAMHGMGDFRGARPLIDRWSALIAKQRPETTSTRSNELMQLAVVYQYSGQRDRAEQLTRGALDIDRVVYGPRHRHTAMTMIQLGLILDEEHKPEDAEPLLRDGLAILRTGYPAGHPDVAGALRSLALMLDRSHRYDEAVPLLREALPMARRFAGEESMDFMDVEQELTFALTMSGHGRESEPLARDVLRRNRAKYGDKNLMTVRARIFVADAQRAQGKFAEAEPALLSAYETLKDGRGLAASIRGFAANALARLYDAKGQPDEAARYRALAQPPAK